MNIYNTLHAGSVTHNTVGLSCRECIENLDKGEGAKVSFKKMWHDGWKYVGRMDPL